jgi:hypothetical protein
VIDKQRRQEFDTTRNFQFRYQFIGIGQAFYFHGLMDFLPCRQYFLMIKSGRFERSKQFSRLILCHETVSLNDILYACMQVHTVTDGCFQSSLISVHRYCRLTGIIGAPVLSFLSLTTLADSFRNSYSLLSTYRRSAYSIV